MRALREKIGAGQALVSLLLDALPYYFEGCSAEFFRHPVWLHNIIKSQDAIGWGHLLYGRLSKLWAEAHERLLKEKGVEITAQNSGLAWARQAALEAWALAHGARLGRSKARHGAASEEQAEKKRERLLAEAELRHSHRENGDIVLDEEEEKIFHNNFEEHEKKEGTLAKMKAWLGTFGSLLQNKLPDVMMSRRREAREQRS